MADMQGRVALVTGASSGIGRATAEAFASMGARVVVAARRQDELAALVTEIEARGGEATAVRVDVSQPGDVQRMVDHAVETFGRLDVAVNDAGIEGPLGDITELADEDWDRVLDTNLRGAFLCLKYEARAMLAAGSGGAIVNVGSVNSFLGSPSYAAYATSKHGLVGLTTSASGELAPRGIRVNLVCPGLVETAMHQRLRAVVGDEAIDAMLPRIHLRRAGRPEEIARAIVFLCSDDASYITGTTLTPDGGFTLTE
jgi:NAD(P)-dependent dehydrogenase (short-subunit alcohol dehydrogenase family)